MVGQVSVEAIKYGAALKCLTTGNPLACSISHALNSAAGNGLAKRGVTQGCRWTVKTSGRYLRIIIKSGRNQHYKMKRAYNALNSINGLYWLKTKL